MTGTGMFVGNTMRIPLFNNRHRFNQRRSILGFWPLGLVLSTGPLTADDQPQWGHAWTRNLVSTETNLPASFDPETGDNVRWSARLGSESHSTPVIADGRIYIGTNNNDPRDPKHRGDRGVLMCFNESDGSLLWQLVVPKRSEDPYFDWPNSGISSPATVEGDRVYIVSNRGEVICLAAKGLADGNDGPFQHEGWHMTPPPDADAPPRAVAGAPIQPKPLPPVGSQPELEPGPLDADILWIFDMVAETGVWPHDGAHSSILIHGDHLYLNTGTGVDNTHKAILAPDSPSLIVLDKHSGRLLARDNENIAPDIFHCSWSSPSLGTVDGRELIFFAGGNGVVYAFEPWQETEPTAEPGTLKCVWKYELDPDAPKDDVHRYNQNRREGPSNVFGLPVFHDGLLYVAGGGDIWWGKNEAWLKCIDPSGTGDITGTATVWSYELGRHVMSSPVIYRDMVFIADSFRQIHCLDRETGERLWMHEAKGEFWASPMVADGKMYIGSRRGDFWVFAAEREKRVLAEFDLGDPISATAVAANGRLYVATMKRLFALEKGIAAGE